MVIKATKQNYELRHIWSQTKAQQLLLLNTTLGRTSWNYIFSDQAGFRLVFPEKQITENVLSKMQIDIAEHSGDRMSIFSPRSLISFQWLRILLYINIRLGDVNMSKYVINRHFQMNYRRTTIFEGRAYVVKTYRCPIFKWDGVTLLKERAPGW